MSRSRLGLLAVLVSLASGCSLAFDSPDTVANTCSSEAPCPSGECVDGMCVTAAIDHRMSVSLEVVPPEAASPTGLVSAVFAPQEIVASEAHDLALPEPVLVRGGAFVGESDTRVAVQFTFTPRPAFEGAPTGFIRVLADTGDFAVTLEADRTYDVLVEPSTALAPGDAGTMKLDSLPPSDLFPPVYLEGVIPSLMMMENGARRLEILYPEDLAEPCTELRADACTLEGRVLGQDVAGVTTEEAGLRVRALASDGRVVSTSALTDQDGGFSIRITPGADPYVLSVTVPDQSGELPDVTTPVDLATSVADRTVLVPRLTPVTLMGLVGYLADDVLQLVGGAAIRFESVSLVDLDLGGEVSFSRTAITASAEASTGQFEVELLPGTYRAVVTPTELDVAGVLVSEVTIDVRSAGSVIMGQLYSLPYRARYKGEVTTPRGEPVPQVTLRARRVPVPDSIELGDVRRFGRSSETSADLEGAYVLPLDVGVYDLVIRPGAETGFPWQIFHDVAITKTVGDVILDATLSAPLAIEGVITSSEGEPVPAALVRAYAVLDTDGVVRTVQIGEATADAEGRYRLLLPPGLD